MSVNTKRILGVFLVLLILSTGVNVYLFITRDKKPSEQVKEETKLEEIPNKLDLSNKLISDMYDFITYESENNLVEHSIYRNKIVTSKDLSLKDKIARVYNKFGNYISMNCEEFNKIGAKMITNPISGLNIKSAFICNNTHLEYVEPYNKDGYPITYTINDKVLNQNIKSWFGKEESLTYSDFSPNYNTNCIHESHNLYCFSIPSHVTSNTHHEFLEAKKFNDRIEIYNRFAFADNKGNVYDNTLKENLIVSGYKPSDNIFEMYKDSKYKHTFKMKNDGTYFWYSTEPIK